ncbi:hypothetical protein OCK74_23100 [Chitinophagaceae bacterium LB-8]|uniref:Lipocalin-like domain-containing protein n=1 Tax=Paraflavisolibacter caeni TaxID=2982496 RepID=A0A9X2XZZ3_9BACT|nr:hypothetical protein [Paraflavisolibacter caeni]MCU7552027.1 hypothetical protein [Paraflavisolibacter caeni]
MKCCVVIWFLLMYSQFLNAQDISGVWKGTLTMQNGCFAVNHIELQINLSGAIASGNSYHYLDVDNYVKKKFKGLYDAAMKTITLHEGLVTGFNIPPTCTICIKNYVLTYHHEGNLEYLSGGWDGKEIKTGVDCVMGQITLSRVKESAFKDIPEIKVDTGEIRLDFYDNGAIDGDTISIMVNKQVVLAHQRLTANPITTYIKIDPSSRFQEVEMIAENLGSIPPNTALLIITVKDKRYKLQLSSVRERTARVMFLYDPDDE